MNAARPTQAAQQAWASGDIDGAIQILRTALAAAPADANLLVSLADYLWIKYEFKEALGLYEQTTKLEQANAQFYVQIAQRLFSLGRFEPARHWLETAVNKSSPDAALLTMLAEVSERCDRLDDAERCGHDALALDPENTKAQRLLAHVERRRGNFIRARDLLVKHLNRARHPEDWRLRMELAAVLDRLGEFDEAMHELILAKEQLRPIAQKHLEAGRALRLRQQEIAQHLKSHDIAAWFGGNASDSPVKIGILCGHPRSGTTLLEQLLAAHPQVVSTDENGIWQREFLDPIIRQPSTAAAAIRELNSFDAEQIAAGRAAYLRFTEAHLDEPINDRVLIDKDPSLTPDLPLPLRLFPETKVIFPIRDPRDICISYFFTILPLNRISGHALDLVSTAEFCAHSFNLWQHWREVIPGAKLETRYEKLVADPAAEMRRLLDFLGLDWDQRVLNFYRGSFSKGVRTPTYADVAQPVYTRSIGRWKNYERHLEPCLSVLAPASKAFGYL